MSALILDLRAPELADNPAQWPTLTPEERAILRPRNGIYSPQAAAILDRLALGRFFLLRNDGPHGERWRCKYCKGIHPFFTLCVPVPLNGLTYALGLLCERLDRDDVYSAVAIGTIEPLDLAYARRLYDKLRGLGYTRLQILGK
jgi:hypothetical protein